MTEQNGITTESLAAEIAVEHEAAQRYAGKAIEHAKRAGELLEQVKERLPHGEFLPWIDNNLDVSRRQAQRYMRAAKGKPMTPRQIKNDTVSHLPKWLPPAGKLATACTKHGWIEVQTVEHAPGYYQFLVIDGMNADYLKRGIHASELERALIDTMPPASASEGPGGLVWTHQDAPGDWLRGQIEQLEAMPQGVML